MKKVLLLLAVLVGGIVVVRRLLPADIRERIMGRMIEHMPEN
jgi:hypothetical protein